MVRFTTLVGVSMMALGACACVINIALFLTEQITKPEKTIGDSRAMTPCMFMILIGGLLAIFAQSINDFFINFNI